MFIVGAQGTNGAAATKHRREIWQNNVQTLVSASSTLTLSLQGTQTFRVGWSSLSGLANRWMGSMDEVRHHRTRGNLQHATAHTTDALVSLLCSLWLPAVHLE